ncbi:MAG TPA: peroxiredoxin [Microbacteriaceae bacterium]|nr:peroxiredoxin [Microbacteriaceae bacterium]
MAFEDLLPLRVGDTAPDFTLPDEHGEPVALSRIAATKPVVLVFVPGAFTATCTGEYCELRDNISLFQDAHVQLLGISTDPKAALRVWKEQEQLEFPLLSDFWPHGEVARAYGVFLEERGAAARATFVIDDTLTVRAAFVNPPSEPRPLAAYREALAALG